jgi:hypothetical protein
VGLAKDNERFQAKGTAFVPEGEVKGSRCGQRIEMPGIWLGLREQEGSSM